MLVVLVLAATLVGCGGSAESQLVGTWKFVPDTSKPETSQFGKDLKANVNMKMTIEADGTYTETTDSFQSGSMTVPAYFSEGSWTFDDGEFMKTEEKLDGKPNDDTYSTVFYLSDDGNRLEGTSKTGSKLTYLKE